MLERSAQTAYMPRSPCLVAVGASQPCLRSFYGNDEFQRPGEREKSLWLVRKERSKPDHSQWYIDRFKAMEAEGNDMAGESRLVNAMASSWCEDS